MERRKKRRPVDNPAYPSPLLADRIRQIESRLEKIDSLQKEICALLNQQETAIALLKQQQHDDDWATEVIRGNGRKGLIERIAVLENKQADLLRSLDTTVQRFENWNRSLDRKIAADSGGGSKPTVQELLVETFQKKPIWSVVAIALILLFLLLAGFDVAELVGKFVKQWFGGG